MLYQKYILTRSPQQLLMYTTLVILLLFLLPIRNAEAKVEVTTAKSSNEKFTDLYFMTRNGKARFGSYGWEFLGQGQRHRCPQLFGSSAESVGKYF